jgi:flagellar hook assembly protein FlgD
MARPRPHKRAARLAAISILSVLGAVAAVWAAPRASDAVAAWMGRPPVRLQTVVLTLPLPVGGSAAATSPGALSAAGGTASPAVERSAPVVDAGMRFTMLGVTCTPPADQGEVEILVRTSEDGAAWSRWYTVALERLAEEGKPEQAFTEPIWTGAGRYAQVTARRASVSGRAPVQLRGVHLVAINSTEDADRAAVVVGVLRRAAAAIAGLELAPPVGAMTTKPAIVTRADWGANESWRSGTPSYAPVKMAFVHHTDSGNNYTAAEAPAIVRGVYGYHTKSLHWSDVGYNFLIDRFGTIYEGRYGGMTRGVIGAQVLGFNTGSTGVSVIGTFTSVTPPPKAVTSLERLLAWKLDFHHVDPQGTATLVCGYGQKFATGQRVRFPAIAGHRDANFTDCPGGRLYAQLRTVRRVVAGRGQPKIYGSVVGQPAISPNGDGVLDRASIDFTISEQASWRLEIRDDAGRLVRHVTGKGMTAATTWAGKSDDGKLLPDGVYTLQADATSAGGVARPATATVRLDTVPPRVSSATIAPDPFSPNDDGQGDTTTLRYALAESGSARVSVIAADGTVLRRLTGWRSAGTAASTVGWDGRIGSSTALKPAAEGAATLLLEARDLAGNTAALRRKVTLDRTLALTGVTHRTISPNGDGVDDSATLAIKLTRAADVTATVTHGGSTLRTMRLGRLASGAHSVVWDGTLDAGGTATSGAYALKVTARGAIGVTSVSRALTVDLAVPKVVAPATASVAYGKTARIGFTVRDAYSPTVKVSVGVTDAAGGAIATVALGWVKRNLAQTCSWKPPARGTYTLTFRAKDQGGNRQTTVVTVLKVR